MTENKKAPVEINQVVVHPLVLLSTVDHFYRVSKDSGKRVVGLLLGETSRGRVDITNSYAVPFEEDEKNGSIWFLDHDFHETMFAMFKKINARERIVGWYSTGPKIKQCDIDIHQLFHKYHPTPVYVIIDAHPKELGIPTKAYMSVEQVHEDGTQTLNFQHIPSEIGALEAEEVGVEHLLRDIKDTSISTLATQVHAKMLSLRSLVTHLQELREYLGLVLAKKLPLNQKILAQMQDMFNSLPNLLDESLVRSFYVKTNDSMLVIYLSSLVRSVIALHNLINNKIINRDAERKADEKLSGAKNPATKTATTADKDKKEDSKEATEKKEEKK